VSKRVAIVTHYWSPHVGGIETMAREQANGLVDAGVSVEVFTSRLSTDDREQAREKYPVRRYRCVNWQEEHLKIPVPAVSPRMLRDLVRVARSGGTLVAHGHAYVGSMYAAAASRITGRPLIVIQASPFVSYPEPIQTLEHLVDRTAGRWVLDRAATVICISKYVESYVNAIAPLANTVVMHPGVDTERFSLRPEIRPLSEAGAGRQPIRVLTVRRLVPRNGVDVLVEAWRLAGLGSAAELLIGGIGPELGALRRQAASQPQVRFLGRIPHDDLPALYRSADLVVVPSVSGEGFGLVAAEALASGVPVVATDGGATPEVVRDGVDGMIVPAGNAEALAEALRTTVHEPDLLNQMTLEARDRHEQLGWSDPITRLVELLSDAANTQSPVRWSSTAAQAEG
jgi:glycosyltransferase involved in cell wall biosynthesis